MSEQTLVKVKAEVDKLQLELKSVESAQLYSAALNSLVAYICQTPEPFSAAPPETNQWHQNAGASGGCCIVS